MINGNSACSNSNSFKPNGDGRDLPWWFRHAMPVPVTLVSGRARMVNLSDLG